MLLFIFATSAFVPYSWLQYQKKLVKKQVKRHIMAGLDRQDLVLLKFTEAEAQAKLRWEHAREFEYEGQMFDVVEREIRGDTLFYWCWWDSEETMLNKELSALAARVWRKDARHQQQQQRLTWFFESLFCADILSWQMPVFRTGDALLGFWFSAYSFFNLPPPVPPPETLRTC